MFKKMLTILAISTAFLLLTIGSAMAYQAFHGPTELLFYDPTKAYNGVTMFGSHSPPIYYFVDMDGRLLHKIHCPPGVVTQWNTMPLDNGNFLMLTYTETGGPNGTMGSTVGHIWEINWWGNVVWQYHVPEAVPYSAEGGIHHEARKIWNKKLNEYTYLFAGGWGHTAADAQALGAKGPYKDWSDERIVEVDRAGNIVWKWEFFDHFCQNFDSSKANYVADVSTLPGRLDINVYHQLGTPPISGGLPMDWTHCNSVDYNQDNGLVLINSRNLNEFFMINHDKTFVITSPDPVTGWQANYTAAAGPDGDFVYRFGDPANYNQGSNPGWSTNGNQQMWGAHNVQWIRQNEWPINNWNNPHKGPALNGYGHLLIYDNGNCNSNTMGSVSQLLELNPYVTGAPTGGVYPTGSSLVNPPAAGYTNQPASWAAGYGPFVRSNQIVWRFAPRDTTSFSSPYVCAVQRLPNGNTFADAGQGAHLFEITTAGQVVWEYVVPVWGVGFNPPPAKASIFKYSDTGTALSAQGQQIEYRASRWSITHPAFKNHLVQYSNGTIQAINHNEPGVGFTITGAIPCRNVPCQYVGSP